MLIIELGRRLVRRGDAQCEIGIGPQFGFHFLFGARRQTNPDVRRREMKLPNDAHQAVEDEILAGGDAHFPRGIAGMKQFAQFAGTLQKRHGVRQKPFALRCQRGGAADSAALVIQFDAESPFQGDQSVAHALLGNVQHFAGAAQATLAGNFDQRGHLIGRKTWRVDHIVRRAKMNTTKKIMTLIINSMHRQLPAR